MVGDEANTHRSMLQLQQPIQNGVIQDWDAMEAVWSHTFKLLGINPQQHFVVQTEAALNPPKNREKIVETMFEKYGFAGVNVSVQAILALGSQGLNTGFVVDSGDGVTHLVPVTEGYVEPALVKRHNLAGRHVTDHFMKLLASQGHALNSTADFETLREMKQKLCYVALDLEAEKKLARETTLVDRQYTLPDSRVIRVGAERFLGPELLFSPHLFGKEEVGMADSVFQTIRKSDLHVQKGYFGHIVLSGGTTMFPGLSSRLEKDIKKLYLDNVLQGDTTRQNKFKCHVEDPPRRQHMVFHGASIYADSYPYDSLWWIKRSEYQEQGARVVQRLIATKLS
jgi:actin-related protein 2